MCIAWLCRYRASLSMVDALIAASLVNRSAWSRAGAITCFAVRPASRRCSSAMHRAEAIIPAYISRFRRVLMPQRASAPSRPTQLRAGIPMAVTTSSSASPYGHPPRVWQAVAHRLLYLRTRHALGFERETSAASARLSAELSSGGPMADEHYSLSAGRVAPAARSPPRSTGTSTIRRAWLLPFVR